MELKSAFCLTGCTVFLLAGAVSARAQALQNQPPNGPFGEFGRQPGQNLIARGGLMANPGGPGVFGQFGGGGGGGQQPGFGGGGQNRGFGGNGGMPIGTIIPTPVMPEMAKRMTAIVELRQINGVGLTAHDISAALPTLKAMRDAEKTLENHSLQILEEEKRALLSAQPGASPPPDSGQRLQEASAAYHQQMGRDWETITKAIGSEKAHGLRVLVDGGITLRPGGFGGGPMLPGMGAEQPGQASNNLGPGVGGPAIPGTGSEQLGQAPNVLGPGSGGPAISVTGPGQPGQAPNILGPGAGSPAIPVFSPEQPGQAPNILRPGSGPVGGPGVQTPLPEKPGDAAGDAPSVRLSLPGGPGGFGSPEGPQGQFGGGGAGRPGAAGGGQMAGRPNPGMSGMGSSGVRISLANLVELLEQKQSAMRK